MVFDEAIAHTVAQHRQVLMRECISTKFTITRWWSVELPGVLPVTLAASSQLHRSIPMHNGDLMLT